MQRNNSSEANYDKYRLVIPGTYMFVFFLIIAGPTFFPKIFLNICYLTMVIGTFRITYMLICSLVRIYQFYTTPDCSKEPQPDVYHAFIIPSYCEDERILQATLNQLSKHTRASAKYIIMLAMEAAEKGAAIKAEKLISKYAINFLEMKYTVHIKQDHEASGKASNVSYCVERLETIFENKYDFESKVFVTILDCDSLVPNAYIDQVNHYILKDAQKSFKSVFQTGQIFKRNDRNVPVFTRTFDLNHAYAHWNTAASYFQFSTPWGNYTLAYKLIKSVGFWDKCPDAIGEDIHTFSKIFWRRDGDAYSIPLQVPFNSLNLDCGDDYIENCKAKFNQAVRHGHGIFECSYSIYEYAKTKTFSFKRFSFLVYTLDILLYNSTFSIYLLMYLAIRAFFLPYETNPIFFSLSPIIMNLLNYFNLCNILSLFIFDIYRRAAYKKYYENAKRESWLTFLEYFVFITVGLHVFFSGSFFYASFKGMFSAHKYNVAEKVARQQKND